MPPATYVGVILNVTIVTLARNYSARTSELFPFGAKLILRTDYTLRRNFSAVCKFGPSWKIVRYVDLARWREIIFPLGCGIGYT